MATAKITLFGFAQWMKLHDSDLFSDINLPDGIDKTTLENSILMKGGEFEIIYANPYFMQEMIGVWSAKWYRTFEKWYDALQLEYDPIANYDRKEEWTTDNTGSTETTGTSSGTSNTSNQTDGSATAYDSDTLHQTGRDTSTGTGSVSNTNTGNTDTTAKEVKTGRAHGNIGVTTSQQMLQSELEIAEWNLYEHITDLFLKELTIPVY